MIPPSQITLIWAELVTPYNNSTSVTYGQIKSQITLIWAELVTYHCRVVVDQLTESQITLIWAELVTACPAYLHGQSLVVPDHALVTAFVGAARTSAARSVTSSERDLGRYAMSTRMRGDLS